MANTELLESALASLASVDDAEAEAIQRQLRRSDAQQRQKLWSFFEDATGILRRRLAEVLGRAACVDDQCLAQLRRGVADPDPRVRRPLLRCLGRLGGLEAEAILLATWRSSGDLPELRAVARALASLNTPAAQEALSRVPVADPELARLCAESQALSLRVESRQSPTQFLPERKSPGPLKVVFHVRTGLEELLVSEMVASQPQWAPRVLGHGRVGAVCNDNLLNLWTPRLALFWGFALTETPQFPDEIRTIVEALTSPLARNILQTWTRGPLRFRLEWHGRGHQRAASLKIAEQVRQRWPELVNDTVQAPWEARVITSHRGVHVELVPVGLSDPRFDYRRATVPASSHPTVAAALARLGGAKPDDIVWDPFVGAGTELAERARLGPYRRLLGTDVDPKAIAAATLNLSELKDCTLVAADALQFIPEVRPSLILTNPPLGRRCPTDVIALTRKVLRQCAEMLGPDGRLVWITPMPGVHPDGLEIRQALDIDLGGFSGQMQLLQPRKFSTFSQ